MITSKAKRTKVFISYCHEDKQWRDRLEVHLKPLEIEGLLVRWDDTMIQPGSRWEDEIKKALHSAKVAVLLVSADFLASDFIINHELPTLLEKAKRDGAVILPLIVSPCRFQQTPSLFRYQSVNDPSKPLIRMSAGESEETFFRVTLIIERTILNSRTESIDKRQVTQTRQKQKKATRG